MDNWICPQRRLSRISGAKSFCWCWKVRCTGQQGGTDVQLVRSSQRGENFFLSRHFLQLNLPSTLLSRRRPCGSATAPMVRVNISLSQEKAAHRLSQTLCSWCTQADSSEPADSNPIFQKRRCSEDGSGWEEGSGLRDRCRVRRRAWSLWTDQVWTRGSKSVHKVINPS